MARGAPDIKAPADRELIPVDPCECQAMPFALEWDRQCDACVYDIQIALAEDFTEVVVNIQAYEPPAGVAPRYLVAKGALSCEVTYYWRAGLQRPRPSK